MMYEHFNNLSPAQHEALTKLMEEASEISQAVAKILLHGLESTEPGQGLSNREKLQNELGDLMFFMQIAAEQGVIHPKEVGKACQRREKRVNHYLHHIEVD